MLTWLQPRFHIIILLALLAGRPAMPRHAVQPAPLVQSTNICTWEFLPVSPALIDLGSTSYTRMDGAQTGFTGGLYPNGSNQRPAAHTADGLRMASLVLPRNALGEPDPNGKIGLLGVGMSNTAGEFFDFMRLASSDTTINPRLVLVNGAQPGKVASEWIDPQADTYTYVDNMLVERGVTPQQVQVAWVKLTNFLLNDFPNAQYQLQSDLQTTLHNLKEKFPNLVITYFSSRTRSYTYWQGLNPEPGAFETGFAVKWLVEAQISGDPDLNFDPARGAVVAPYISWGPYLWADGHNPRSDGLTWMEIDMVHDCTHPSPQGEGKVAHMLLDFLKTDVTARTWFLAGDTPLPTPEPQYYVYIPGLVADWEGVPGPSEGMRFFTPR